MGSKLNFLLLLFVKIKPGCGIGEVELFENGYADEHGAQSSTRNTAETGIVKA